MRRRNRIPNGYTTAQMLDDCTICEQTAEDHSDPFHPERDHDIDSYMETFLDGINDGFPMEDGFTF